MSTAYDYFHSAYEEYISLWDAWGLSNHRDKALHQVIASFNAISANVVRTEWNTLSPESRLEYEKLWETMERVCKELHANSGKITIPAAQSVLVCSNKLVALQEATHDTPSVTAQLFESTMHELPHAMFTMNDVAFAWALVQLRREELHQNIRRGTIGRTIADAAYEILKPSVQRYFQEGMKDTHGDISRWLFSVQGLINSVILNDGTSNAFIKEDLLNKIKASTILISDTVGVHPGSVSYYKDLMDSKLALLREKKNEANNLAVAKRLPNHRPTVLRSNF